MHLYITGSTKHSEFSTIIGDEHLFDFDFVPRVLDRFLHLDLRLTDLTGFHVDVCLLRAEEYGTIEAGSEIDLRRSLECEAWGQRRKLR